MSTQKICSDEELTNVFLQISSNMFPSCTKVISLMLQLISESILEVIYLEKCVGTFIVS